MDRQSVEIRNLKQQAASGSAESREASAAIGRLRAGRIELSLMTAVTLAIVVAIAGAVAIQVLQGAGGQAKSSVVLQDLHTLRTQIQRYKIEHAGQSPVAYQGSLPQLLRATNTKGVPGPAGHDFPHGPYLHNGIPANVISGISVITLTETFPPEAASGNRGWLYHQASGQIAIDLPEYLDE